MHLKATAPPAEVYGRDSPLFNISKEAQMANQAVRVPEPSVESSASGVHWGAITAGALGAVGITFVLISLGPAKRASTSSG